MRTFASLPRAFRLGMLMAVLGSIAAVAPAHAFTVTNSDPQLRAKVSIDYWLRWVNAGQSVVFHPEAFPVTVYVQYPEGTLTCEATSDSDVIELTKDECLVNGEPAGQTTMRF
ncbi:MAG: hypothetical protein OXG16_12555 [Rhodospirillales bacterium]|nr:hypothetical protein [Rhodospirillales bacterium]MDE0711564.1 hypothetical protein [Rhodospirillales bacterium]